MTAMFCCQQHVCPDQFCNFCTPCRSANSAVAFDMRHAGDASLPLLCRYSMQVITKALCSSKPSAVNRGQTAAHLLHESPPFIQVNSCHSIICQAVALQVYHAHEYKGALQQQELCNQGQAAAHFLPDLTPSHERRSSNSIISSYGCAGGSCRRLQGSSAAADRAVNRGRAATVWEVVEATAGIVNSQHVKSVIIVRPAQSKRCTATRLSVQHADESAMI